MARLNSYFWNFIAKKYSKDPIIDQKAYQRKLELTRSYMHQNMRVLEIGCGTGTIAIAHAPFVKQIDAIDVSSNMLAIAKEKLIADNISNITFTQVKLEDMKTDPKTYDMVMAHSVLHLLDDKNVAIARIKKMLKPEGIFVSSTACISDHRALKFFLPIGNALGLLPLVRFFSPKELLSSISGAGFEILHQWQPGKDKAMFIIAKKEK
ncbi:MAG: class I SAM-dependent methyltransferase [Devosiaceae bacterium]|nr:class I SAM-dependent methyltransferase [Devosiaceae bacterium]